MTWRILRKYLISHPFQSAATPFDSSRVCIYSGISTSKPPLLLSSLRHQEFGNNSWKHATVLKDFPSRKGMLYFLCSFPVSMHTQRQHFNKINSQSKLIAKSLHWTKQGRPQTTQEPFETSKAPFETIQNSQAKSSSAGSTKIPQNVGSMCWFVRFEKCSVREQYRHTPTIQAEENKYSRKEQSDSAINGSFSWHPREQHSIDTYETLTYECTLRVAQSTIPPGSIYATDATSDEVRRVPSNKLGDEIRNSIKSGLPWKAREYVRPFASPISWAHATFSCQSNP